MAMNWNDRKQLLHSPSDRASIEITKNYKDTDPLSAYPKRFDSRPERISRPCRRSYESLCRYSRRCARLWLCLPMPEEAELEHAQCFLFSLNCIVKMLEQILRSEILGEIAHFFHDIVFIRGRLPPVDIGVAPTSMLPKTFDDEQRVVMRDQSATALRNNIGLFALLPPGKLPESSKRRHSHTLEASN